MCKKCSLDQHPQDDNNNITDMQKAQSIIDMLEFAIGQSTNINNINVYKRTLIKSLTDQYYNHFVRKVDNIMIMRANRHDLFEKTKESLINSIDNIINSSSGAEAGMAYAKGTMDLLETLL